MITKTVTSGERAATATISEEIKFVFSGQWNFYHVQNMGTSVAYISMATGATAGADGVIAVIAGGTACTMHNFPADSVYVTSSATTDSVQIIGSNSAISPFKSGKKGGGTNTSDATATAADIIADKTAYIADGTKATGTAVQGIYPIGTNGRPTGSVTVPSGVTSLYQYIFYQNVAVTSVNLPNSLISISDYAFQYCSSLLSITIPSSVTSLGNNCFNGCTSITSITIPSSVTSLGNNCFNGCTSITSITIPSSVTSLGTYCFNGCTGLTTAIFEDGCLIISEYTFIDCNKLVSVTIPTSVTLIKDAAFYRCTGLTSITIPTSVTSLGSNCFNGCTSITSITIPSSVTSLGTYCFQDCTNLLSAIVSSNVVSLTATFYRCNKLVEITLNRAVITFDTYVFYNCSAMTILNTVLGFNPTGLNLSTCTALTSTSMVSMFNNLATIGTTKTITLGATNLAKLSAEQKAIATGKGWALA